MAYKKTSIDGVGIFVTIVAVILNILCNSREFWIFRIIFAIGAFFFPAPYIYFYSIYHLILGQPCAPIVFPNLNNLIGF
jgi:hypothetical protein